MGTMIDPTLTCVDRLVGQVLGEVGELLDVFVELDVYFEKFIGLCILSYLY